MILKALQKNLEKGNPSKDNCLSTDNNYMLNKNKPTDKSVKKMKEKYGGTKNFVKERSPKVVSEDKSSSSKGLDKTDTVSKTKDKKKNENLKVVINEHNNYAPDIYALRKVSAKCGSVNHLSIDCKTIVSSTPSQ